MKAVPILPTRAAPKATVVSLVMVLAYEKLRWASDKGVNYGSSTVSTTSFPAGQAKASVIIFCRYLELLNPPTSIIFCTWINTSPYFAKKTAGIH